MSFRENINPVNGQSIPEEIANAVSHGLGAALSIAGLVLLLVFAAQKGDPWKIVSFSLFGASMIILYLSSTLYHAMTNEKVKKVLRVFDHSSVYILIAGTYTPFLLLSLRGTLGWSLFAVIWGCAITGTLFKIRSIEKSAVLSSGLYLSMGWMIIFAIRYISAALPFQGVVLIFTGGAVYSLGVIFFLIDTRIPFAHSIWHLFVLGGSISFFLCHFLYVL